MSSMIDTKYSGCPSSVRTSATVQADPDAPPPCARSVSRTGTASSVEEPLQPTLVVHPIVRVGDVLETHPEQLILRVADDLGDPTIHPQPASVRSDQGDADDGLFESRVEKSSLLRWLRRWRSYIRPTR